MYTPLEKPKARFSPPFFRYFVLGSVLCWAVLIGLVLLIFGCGGGSSAGAGSSSRVPLTPQDEAAIAMLGGFGGEWLPQTRGIIRLDEPPPPGANWARAWKSKCRDSFTIYETTRGKPPEWLAGLFAHEAQHHVDGCRIGEIWEQRADDAARCFNEGVPRNQCVIRDA